jgi:citrate synthase
MQMGCNASYTSPQPLLTISQLQITPLEFGSTCSIQQSQRISIRVIETMQAGLSNESKEKSTPPPLDGPALSPDRLTVRGKDLNDLVGKVSYPAALFHLLTGDLPSQTHSQRLATWLLDAMRSLTPDQPLAALVRHSASLGATDIGAVLAGLALGDALGLPSTLDTSPLEELGLKVYSEGLYYFAIAPLLHAYALEHAAPAEIEARWALLADPTIAYIEAIYIVVSGKQLPNRAAHSVFDAVMVAFHAGLGTIAPTILLPRAAIATRTSTAMALAAGYSAAGPAHVGACKMVMAFFTELVATAPSSDPSNDPSALAAHTRATLDALLAAQKRVAGFGHPLFSQDPRTPHLRALIEAHGLASPYLKVYDSLSAHMVEQRGLHPNIDAIAAALFLTLDIAPHYGTALFLCARMAAMVAHIEEARHAPAFGARREAIRASLG